MREFQKDNDINILGCFDEAQKVHNLKVQIHYEDTDFSGVVYHANYLKFAERGRSNFLKLCGITHSDLLALEPSLAFVVGHMDMDFLMPARIDDVLLVETVFTEARGARLQAEQRISVSGNPVWQARVKAACIDLDGKPKRLPDFVAAGLQPHLGASFLADG